MLSTQDLNHFFSFNQMKIWVIDSSKNNLLENSLSEFNYYLSLEELIHTHVVVVCNMQDENNAMKIEEIEQRINKDVTFIKQRPWKIFGTPSSGEGIKNVFIWLDSTFD